MDGVSATAQAVARRSSAPWRRFQSVVLAVQVGATSDGGEVLAQAQSLRPQVVVIDLGTPGLTGLETISHLRATMPDVGLIAMSLLGASGYRRAALAAGADDFVPKGALANDLPPAIRRVAQDCRSPERPVGNGGER